MDPLDQLAFGTLERSIRIHGVALEGLTILTGTASETSHRRGLPYARQLCMPDGTSRRRRQAGTVSAAGLEVQAALRFPKD
jgi:hypothetical protein